MHRFSLTAARRSAVVAVLAAISLTGCAGVDQPSAPSPTSTSTSSSRELRAGGAAGGAAAADERSDDRDADASSNEAEERAREARSVATARAAMEAAAEVAVVVVPSGSSDDAPPFERDAAPPRSALHRTEQLGEPGVVEIGAWHPPVDPDAASKPVIEDVYPTKGAVTGGEKVVIRGKNLDAAQVVFGMTPARVLKVTAEEITVAAPAEDPGAVTIVITTRSGQYAMAQAPFEYYN